MKTIRDIFHENGLNYSQVVGEENTVVSMGLGSFNQALKELEEVILESLPEKKKKNGNTLVQPQFSAEEEIRKDGYNLALEDTRKAIKELMK